MRQKPKKNGSKQSEMKKPKAKVAPAVEKLKKIGRLGGARKMRELAPAA